MAVYPAVELEEPFLEFTKAPFIERVSPYRVSLFLLAECVAKEYAADNFDPATLGRIAFSFNKWIEIHNMPLKKLMASIQNDCTGELANLLEESIDSTKNDDGPVIKASEIFARGFPARNSLLGFFLRRLELASHQFTLSEVAQFNEKWRLYTSVEEPALVLPTSPSPDSSMQSTFSSPDLHIRRPLSMTRPHRPRCDGDGGPDSAQPTSFVSRREALLFISKQLRLMESNPKAAKPYAVVEAAGRRISRLFPELYEVHFMRCVNEIRGRDLRAAETALHDYLDWVSLAMLYRNNHQSPASTPAHLSKSMRYGPLLVCKLLRHFNLKTQARRLLENCIENIQESGDSVCLQHLLLENGRLSEEDPANAVDLLNQIGAIESQIDTQQMRGEKRSLRVIREKSQIEKVRMEWDLFSSPQAAMEELERLTPGQGEASRDVDDVRHAFLSSITLAQGRRELSVQYAESVLGGNHGSKWSSFKMRESHVICYCNIAYALNMDGMQIEALEVIGKCSELLPASEQSSTHWKLCESIINFERALFTKGDYETADSWLQKICGLSESEYFLRRSMLAKARGDADSAIQCLQSLCQSKISDKAGDWQTLARCFLGIGELYTPICPSTAEKYLQLGEAQVKKHPMEGLKAAFTLQMAAVKIQRKHFEAARELLNQCEEGVLKHCGIVERIKLRLLRARTLYSFTVPESGTDPLLNTVPESGTELLLNTVTQLNSALADLEKLECQVAMRDVYYILAMLYDRLDDEKKLFCAFKVEECGREEPELDPFNVLDDFTSVA